MNNTEASQRIRDASDARDRGDSQGSVNTINSLLSVVNKQGDAKGAGRALVDAVAAGCVPLLLGSVTLPLAKLLRYDSFTRTIEAAEFLRSPAQATQAVIDAAVPQLATLRRALVAAREDLILGFGTAPLAAAAGTFATTAAADFSAGRGADLALLEVGRTICSRSPSSFGACFSPQDLPPNQRVS